MQKRMSLFMMVLALFVLCIVPAVKAQDEVRVVSFMTTFGGSELDALRVSLDEFTNRTGIQVIVESNRQLVPILRTRIAGGSPPDVALIPQPGTLAEFARGGALIPLVNADGSAGLIEPSVLTDNYVQSLIDLGTVDGVVYGFFAKFNSKSTVWYRPASFEEMGFAIPETWDDLMAIQQAYIDAGRTPWSIGGADWWTLTDWFENLYVRVNGPEMYMQLFLTHEIPWTDQSVVDTMEIFRQVVDPADQKLAGGVEGTLSTDFISAANLVFRPDPAAEMYYEGGFMGGIISNNFPELTPVEDFTAFLFPAVNETYGAPVMGGGDLIAAFRDTPEVAELLNWMASVDANTLWAQTGAVVSPNKNVDLAVYSPLGLIDAAQVAGATTLVFDGSDLMPGAASSAMGTALQEFIADPDAVMDLLQDIEDAAVASY